MNLKEIFSKAENGTLTYEQFMSMTKDNNAKFVDLSEGNYVDRQKYNDDLASRDTRISSLDEMVKSRDTDLESLRTQLNTAGTDSTKLANLEKEFTSLQQKYDDDTKALEKRMAEQNYRHAVNDFANQQKFSSNAAKRDFVTTLLSKNLPMENDVIVGATDFRDIYSKENADAFAVEKAPEIAPNPKPTFAGPTSPESGGGEDNPFTFHFTGVRPHK